MGDCTHHVRYILPERSQQHDQVPSNFQRKSCKIWQDHIPFRGEKPAPQSTGDNCAGDGIQQEIKVLTVQTILLTDSLPWSKQVLMMSFRTPTTSPERTPELSSSLATVLLWAKFMGTRIKV